MLIKADVVRGKKNAHYVASDTSCFKDLLRCVCWNLQNSFADQTAEN